MGRLYNPKLLSLTQINTAQFDVIGGAAGWIDTDVSATTGIDPNRVWIIGINVAASQMAGARDHGSALESRYQINLSGFTLSKVNSAGHMDLYREAADAHYYIMGHLE